MKNLSEIEQQLSDYSERGLELFATSSFQTHSIPLLHIISQIDRTIPVYYLNTGYLFPETVAFKDELTDLLGLKFHSVSSSVPKSQQKDDKGQLLFASDPDYCCFLNKTQPMQPILNVKDVWINGVRRDQNANRAAMKVVEKTPQKAFRYHPMLDWTSKDIYEYRKQYNLPEHPMEKRGYLSIGCEPCTRKVMDGNDERTSRWFGMNKVECGLHTDLIVK